MLGRSTNLFRIPTLLRGHRDALWRMLGWSVGLFRIRGIRLELHFTFLLLIAYAAYDGWAGARWIGLRWEVATLLAFFTCVVLHELGHSFTAMHFGIGVRRILLMPIGGMAEFEDIPRQPVRELLITLAGPAVNFVIVGALWFVVPNLHHVIEDDYTLLVLLKVVWKANLAMGTFNLLPAFPMDGGRIFRALLATRLPYLRATFWAATVGKILAGLGVLFALTAGWLHLTEDAVSSYILAVLFSFIMVAGEVEYRVVKRRERDDAHWQQTLSRLNLAARPSSQDEPPALAS